MNNETMLPMDWKPLREAAVLAAEEVQTLYRRNDPARRDIASGVAGRSAVAMEVVAAHAALLADFTRPASRDWGARLLAEKVGLTVGATAPEWRRFRMALPNGTESWAWALLGKPGEQFFFTDGNAPGISTLTDPAAALRAALLAVVPA